jgi:7-cyano-7-deazaguanine reductase
MGRRRMVSPKGFTEMERMKNEPTPNTQFQAHDRTLPFKGPEAIEADVLECFEYEYADKPVGQDMEISTVTDEFTSVCPFSGLPDFAQVTITYTPIRHCVELRSLKYYLMSYRDVGIWYEHLVNRILEDLVKACRPRRMTVVVECSPRGGLASTVTAEYDRERHGEL